MEKAKIKSNEVLHKLTDESKMLGALISILEKNVNIDKEFISDLRRVADIRGYYAHRFFKEDLYTGHLDDDPLYYKAKISEDVGFIYSVHCQLFEVDEENRYLVNKAKNLGL